MRPILVSLLAALGAIAPSPAPPPAATAPRTIRVTGDGRATATPDVAVVSLGVEALEPSLAQTTADANDRMRKVLAALQAAGVASRDVRTTRYDVAIERPWKDGKPGPISGYRVSTAAEARVHDLAKLGAVLDRAVAAGSNAVSGLRLEKEDPSAERSRALAAAVASARAKAEAIAKAAGVALGEVLSVSEGGGVPIPVPKMAIRAAEAEGAPVSPGEIEIAAAVEVVFAIR